MSPRKRSLVGPSLPVDRAIRHLGRIRHASGLHSRAQLDRLNEYITEQARTPDGRMILSHMVGKNPPLRADVFFYHAKAGTLNLLRFGAAVEPLVPALTAWREKKKDAVAADTYRTRKELITNVEKYARPGALVSELPQVMRLLSDKMNGARQFNYCLDYARAFVRDTLGRRNETYLDVADIDKREVTEQVVRHPLMPNEILAIAAAFDVVRAKRIAASTAKRGKRPIEARGTDTIVLALTGMNPKEYQGDWQVRDHHVHIDGTKRAPRVRDIPKAFPCGVWADQDLPRPSVGQKNYWRWFKEAAAVAGIPCTPYDLRRTFSVWMIEAGIDRWRRRVYLGHKIKDVTERYERHAVDKYLVGDGQMLQAWINAALRAPEPDPKA